MKSSWFPPPETRCWGRAVRPSLKVSRTASLNLYVPREIRLKRLAVRSLGGLLLLAGATFVVAALGGLDRIGMAGLPQDWVFGLAGLGAGRLLLAEAFPGHVKRPAPEMDLEAALEFVIGTPSGSDGDSPQSATQRGSSA